MPFKNVKGTTPCTLMLHRLVRVYKNAREHLRNCTSINKVYFHSTNREAVLGWITPMQIELYACFSITTSKAAAIAACESIKKWLKKEEDELFIASFKTF